MFVHYLLNTVAEFYRGTLFSPLVLYAGALDMAGIALAFPSVNHTLACL